MRTANLIESGYIAKPLRKDDIYPQIQRRSIKDITGMEGRRGLDKVIISGGRIVNVVSERYALLDNSFFFGKVEEKLRETGFSYKTRYINRENGSFAADYILDDDDVRVNIKGADFDVIRPMLRFTNSYDGSAKTSGSFGFFREVCQNGLHVAHAKINFNIKHVGDMQSLTVPHIGNLIAKFMDNEFYALTRKMERMNTEYISDRKTFVKEIADFSKLFKYESSAQNPEPSLNARLVLETLEREAAGNGGAVTLWHGYNAFNELLHGKLKKTFEQQQRSDTLLFNHIAELV